MLLPSESKPILYKGDLYISELEQGVNQGYQDGCNNTQFAFTANTEQKSVTGTGMDNHGDAIGGVSLKQPMNLTISGNTFTPFIKGAWNMGQAVAASETSGSVVDDPQVAHLGKGIKVDHWNVSSVVVTDSTATTTYVLDTDYKVDLVLGLIYPLSTGSISEDEDLLVDYDYAAENGFITDAGTKSTLDWELLLHLENLESQKQDALRVWHFSAAVSGDSDYRSEDHVGWSFTGIAKIPTGKTEPYKLFNDFVSA